MKYLLRSGTRYRLSKPGYYNFYYPSDKSSDIIKEVDVDKLGWINFSGLIPIKVPTDALDDITLNSYDVGLDTKFVAVWVEKDALIDIDD